jgi:hypothetical protein
MSLSRFANGATLGEGGAVVLSAHAGVAGLFAVLAKSL